MTKKTILDDGFGSKWDKECPECGSERQIVRPGKVQCPNCQDKTSLCYRCEWRAKFLEDGHGPRMECGDIENSKYICYNYRPVKPCVLKYPDYSNEEYDHINKARLPGGMMGARMECKGLADVELEATEIDGNWVFMWILK